MSDFFSEITSTAKELLQSWPSIMDFLQTAEGPNGEKFNLEADIPGTNKALWWFDERILSAGNLLASLEKAKPDTGAPLPEPFVAELNAATIALKTQVDTLANNVEQIKNGQLASLTPTNWVVMLVPNNQQINFASFLQNLVGPIETCLIKYYMVAGIVKSKGFDAFAEAVREFSKKAEEVRKNTKAINTAKTKAEKQTAAIENLKQACEGDKTAITDLLATIKTKANEIDAFHAQSTAAVKTIEEIKQAAENLKTEVDAYSQDFEEFQRTLNERNAKFEKLHNDTESLFKSLTSREQKIGDMIKHADEMLAGATNAGLATTFDGTLKELSTKLGWASVSFYVSIFLLFVSALPLGAYMLATTIDLTQSTNGLPFSIKLGNLNLATTVALFLLMVPTIWLTRFAAARHHQLFQLKEHYQFKYSLAMAVDGFKKQSPKYADEIAATTFQHLSFNPADKLSGQGGSSDHPNPLIGKIMDKLGMNEKGESS
jgi:prefoldin subunit 5